VAILEDMDAPSRGEFLTEAANAYRAREKCQLLLGRTAAAQADAKRAGELDAEAKKLAAAKAKPAASGSVEMVNAWTQPATVLIDGTAYRLNVGERKTISHPVGPFTYSLMEGNGSVVKGNVEAGKTMTIKVVAQQNGP
jgi:ATPase subunit of ABC transporter with duplicated ATPase domains